jgi:hypothetical protein
LRDAALTSNGSTLLLAGASKSWDGKTAIASDYDFVVAALDTADGTLKWSWLAADKGTTSNGFNGIVATPNDGPVLVCGSSSTESYDASYFYQYETTGVALALQLKAAPAGKKRGSSIDDKGE